MNILVGVGIIIFAIVMGTHPGGKDDVMMSWIFGVVGLAAIFGPLLVSGTDRSRRGR